MLVVYIPDGRHVFIHLPVEKDLSHLSQLLSDNNVDVESPGSCPLLETLEKYRDVTTFVKNTPLRVVFSTLFSVFGNVMEHSHECLIYYAKPPTQATTFNA